MLGKTITTYRKALGMTQEQLAQKLEVTNQAVSKWETDQCCPDVQLLPKLADIFGISIDALFGREQKKEAKPHAIDWNDDGHLHIVVYKGHTLLTAVSKENQECTVHYEGPAKDIYCNCNIYCGDVSGNVTAEGYIACGDVEGDVKAGGFAECGDVEGSVSAGSYVECGDVSGNLAAASYVECGDVGGNVSASSYVECGDVGGSVTSFNFGN